MAIPEANPEIVKAALDSGDGVLVDVREPWEYEEVHIPGARLIPLVELPERLGEIPSDVDVYVQCRVGARSARAVEYLLQSGRPRAINLVGGIEGWEDAGLPTE